MIHKSKVLLSNDSAPIHLAGAFDNYIILIPTCKKPDHVLPYRYGRQDFNTVSLYKKLVCDTIDSTPVMVHGQTIDKIIGDFSDYLPDPQTVIDATMSCINKQNP